MRVGDQTLNGRTGRERLAQATLVTRHGFRRLLARFLAPLVTVAVRPARPPARLLIAPQDIRIADPTVADDIYAGHFALADRIVNGHGRTPFEIEPPSQDWAEALHGFSWLRHLKAADTALARANARALVDDWIAASRRTLQPAAWRPAVVARRLMSWLSQSPVILEGADAPFYRRLIRSIVQQTAFLQRCLSNGLAGEERLWAALAIAEVALCTDKTVPRRVTAQFLDELGRQILPDGGHVSRNPQAIVDLLLDLLPLRQVYAARGAEVPGAVLNAIDRMIPMLGLFRHADGALAQFNGMGVTQPETLATIFAYDDARAMPLTNAPYGGYQRISCGESILICDTGQPPPLYFSRQAHAGTLSFEFSTAGQPMIVNCGHPAGADRPMQRAARSTAAHSTLVLADTSSSRFFAGGGGSFGLEGAVMAGPQTVLVQREVAEGDVALEASHDGYRSAGYIHRRGLRLAKTGLLLRGEDDLVPSRSRGKRAAGPEQPFALRFHLHPSARLAYAPGGRSVVIMLSSGDAWRFEAGGLDVAIEESIYFGGAEGPRRSEQIVVQGSVPATPTVRWSLAAEPEP